MYGGGVLGKTCDFFQISIRGCLKTNWGGFFICEIWSYYFLDL